jgi:glyoxylase-like metal-dependent hydrolase (beta-lactamase superfamily II)
MRNSFSNQFDFVKKYFLLALGCLLISSCSSISSLQQPSIKLEITQVSENVFSAIGETNAPSYENSGHNNNLTFIITTDGVVVINGGDNYLLAESLHFEIKKRTQQKVKYVINENGQGHAFLGNSYWKQQGVDIIAHQQAIEEIKKHGHEALVVMQKRNKEKSKNTTIIIPNIGFTDKKTLSMGDTNIELIHFGGAHSPGDISVWLPQQQLIITGDIAFHQRLLGVFPDTVTADWVKSFNQMRMLPIKKVVPGHGAPTDLATITKYTRDYLVYIRDACEAIIEDDGDLNDAYNIDQSAYSKLEVFDILARKNAGRIFREVEEASFQ